MRGLVFLRLICMDFHSFSTALTYIPLDIWIDELLPVPFFKKKSKWGRDVICFNVRHDRLYNARIINFEIFLPQNPVKKRWCCGNCIYVRIELRFDGSDDGRSH